MKKRLPLVFCLFTTAFFATAPATTAVPVTTPSKKPTAPTQTAAPVNPAPTPASRQPAASIPTLTLQDLPSGFEEVPEDIKPQIAAQLETIKQALKSENMTLDNFFAFINPNKLEVVFGFTGRLANQPEQEKFDAAIQQVKQPEEQRQLIKKAQQQLKPYKELQLVGSEPLPELNNVANTSTGMRLALKLKDQPVRVDMAGFRRNTVAAFTAVMYLDGTQPLAPVKDVVSKLDNRILKASPSASMSRSMVVR